MKNLYSLTTLFLFATALSAQVKTDTLVQVEKAERIVITESDSTLRIQIRGTKDLPHYRYDYQISTQNSNIVEKESGRWNFPIRTLLTPHKNLKKRRNKMSVSTAAFQAGFNTLHSTDGNFDNVVGSSADFNLHFLDFHWQMGRHCITTGWGYRWTKIRLEGDQCFNFDGERVSIGNYPDGAQVVRSVLRVNYHTFPLHYSYQFNRKWKVIAGPTLNIAVRPRIYNTYLVNLKEQRDTYKAHLPVTPVYFNLFGAVVWDDLGFFVNYTPTSIFRENFGPQFKTLTMGVTLFY